MFANLVKIELKELYGDEWADCSFIFRKPKASEMIIVNEAQIDFQDTNAKREEEGKTPLEASSKLIEAMETIIANSFVSGTALDEGVKVDVTKEQFGNSFVDLETVIYIFPKLINTQGLVGLEKKSAEVLEPTK
jgi:hypothetical protein